MTLRENVPVTVRYCFCHLSRCTGLYITGCVMHVVRKCSSLSSAPCLSGAWRLLSVLSVQVCRQDSATPSAGRGRGGARRAAGGANQKTSLDDAAWSCDDEVVVTTECLSSSRGDDTSGSQLKVCMERLVGRPWETFRQLRCR